MPEYRVGDRVRIWITGLIPRYTAEVVQVEPLRLRPIDVPNWPAQMRLKDEDYVILTDTVNEHIEKFGDAHVMRTGPLAGKIFALAATTRVERHADEVQRVLDAIGYPEALVTDESSLSDFALEPLEYALAERELGLTFTSDHDLIADLAERLRGGQ